MGKSAKACRIPGQFGSHKKFAKVQTASKVFGTKNGQTGFKKVLAVKKEVEKDIHKSKMAAKKMARRIGSGMNKRSSKEVEMK
jgi:hypothetical protein